MVEVDLDAARAARDAAKDEALAERKPPILVRNGRRYELTPVLYIDAAEAWRRGDGAQFLRLILADPSEAPDFIAGRSKNGKTTGSRLTFDDMDEIVSKAWRFDPGESGASAASSTNGGKRSRRTSPPSTE